MTRPTAAAGSYRAAYFALAVGLAAALPVSAQSAAAGLGTTQWSYAHTLYQKTFLKVDVVTIDICVDAATARRFGPLASRPKISAAAADSITRAALESQRAIGRVAFLRNASLDEFLDGVDEDLHKAVNGGALPDSVYRSIVAAMPSVYAFLRQRGIRKGDQIVYDMEPQTIRTRWIAADGTVLFDRTEPGRERRNSPLATWFARGSSFRNGVLQSLQRDGARAAQEPFAQRCQPGGK